MHTFRLRSLLRAGVFSGIQKSAYTKYSRRLRMLQLVKYSLACLDKSSKPFYRNRAKPLMILVLVFRTLLMRSMVPANQCCKITCHLNEDHSPSLCYFTSPRTIERLLSHIACGSMTRNQIRGPLHCLHWHYSNLSHR